MDRVELQAYAKAAGNDVFGVANIERFDDVPPAHHPRSIFPEARSVIVLGRRVPRGTLRGVEEGTNFQGFTLYGDDWLDNRFTSLCTFRVAEHLEANGWESIPLMCLPPETPPMGISVREGAPLPNVMVDGVEAAVRAGVGEIGYCGTLLTPQFGPRVRIQMIVTDAVIEPDPLLAKPICPGPQQCDAFKSACPMGAFGQAGEINIAGKKMQVAQPGRSHCEACKNGAKKNRYHSSGKPDRLAAFCTRSCIDFLERSKRIGNLFETPLRIRKAWSVTPDSNFFQQ